MKHRRAPVNLEFDAVKWLLSAILISLFGKMWLVFTDLYEVLSERTIILAKEAGYAHGGRDIVPQTSYFSQPVDDNISSNH